MTLFQSLWLCFTITVIVICSVISNAPPLVCAASVSGILFVVGVAFGHKLANMFGAILAAILAYLSYEAGFYGNVIMQVVIFFMSLYGWYAWTKNQSAEGSVIKRSLEPRERRFLEGALVFGIGISCMYTYSIGSNMWLLDGITAILPIAATVLLIQRYRQQWLLWVPYNLLEVIMWFFAASVNPEVLAILAMRIVFFANSIVGYIEWKK